MKQTKERYGTHWDVRTPDEVIAVLETARQNRTRLHISLGYTEHDAQAVDWENSLGENKSIGLDWLEENMSHGYIGRSTGTKKIPLLIPNERSTGGPALLDHCIVRIRTSNGGKVLWQHPQYHHGKITYHRKPIPVEVPSSLGIPLVLTIEVRRDGKEQAAFGNMEEARRYVAKLGLQVENQFLQ
jgi:hypothetical protein